MSQQIKLSSLPYADTRAVKNLTETYHVNRTVWKGCKAILNKLKVIWTTIKEEVRRVRTDQIAVTAQQAVTTAPQVDPQLVNTLRTLFDANPQLKAQVQALLAIVVLQSVQQHQ